jgi:hypothetical protein
VTLINLDRPTDAGRAPAAALRRRPAVVAGLLIAGAVAGSTLTYGIGAQRREQADEQKVAVLLIARPPVDDPSSGVGAALIGSSQFTAQVLVANTGPRAISLQQVTAYNAALSATSNEPAQLVAPGGTAVVDLAVTLTCTATPGEIHTVPPTMTASVNAETVNHLDKTVSPVPLDVRIWFQRLQASLMRCLGGR